VDRIFLDANVLFSTAWRPAAGLRRLWDLEDVELLSSSFAIEEARRNLETPAQRGRLTRLLRRVRIVETLHFTLPLGISLPEKDIPILLASIDGGATHLLTGDLEHFGPYFGQEIAGVLILSPAAYAPITKSETET
jgi:predicted nucleic acid-binding protein